MGTHGCDIADRDPAARALPAMTSIDGGGGRISVMTPDAEQFYKAEPRPVAARLASLRGARVGFIDNRFTAIAILDDAFGRLLAPDDVTSTTIHKRSFGRPLEAAQLRALVEGADAVVSGLCNTPPSTAWGVHDSIELERAGIPTVTLATAYYEALLTETATAEGMPDLRRVILPYPLEGRPEAEVRAVARAAIGPLVAALTEPGGPPIARLADR